MLPLYQIGEVDWLTTQTLYHTLAKLGEEGVVLCWPKTPYVSLGCHQDWEDYNPSSQLPVVRRRVGGSLVYLDRHQVFFQVIVRADRLPNNRTPESWYHYALDPVVKYLKQKGLPARLELPADILVANRKVSGNAGGFLDDMVVIVGNLLLDFSIEAMARARFGPHRVWQQAFTESMQFHLTTLQDEVPEQSWSATEVMADLAEVFMKELGAEPVAFPWQQWQNVLREVGGELTDETWLQATRQKGQTNHYSVKVREGVYLHASRDLGRRPIVAEVDHMSRRVLRLWGSDLENFSGSGQSLNLSLTKQELETVELEEDVKQLLRELCKNCASSKKE